MDTINVILYLCYMNVESVLDFIKEKRGYDYPFVYKLVNGLPLSDDELIVDGSLYLTETNITSLPNNLTIIGDLDLTNTDISTLPDNLSVDGWLDIRGTNIVSIPKNLRVTKSIFINKTPLTRRYFKFQIIKMIEAGGGYCNGDIIK